MKHLICCLTKSFLGWKFLHCWKISLRQISKSNQVYVHTDSTFNTECCQSTDFRIWWTVKVGSAQRPNVLQYTFNGIYNNIAGKTFITAFIFIKPKYFCRSVFNDSLILCTKDNVLHFHLTSDQTFNSWPKCIWYIFRFKCIFYSFQIWLSQSKRMCSLTKGINIFTLRSVKSVFPKTGWSQVSNETGPDFA